MRLNKKGISIIELLITIILISIVLVFLFQLLVDIENETESNNYSYNNQLNRMDALFKIDKDLNTLNPDKTLVRLTKLAIKDPRTEIPFDITFTLKDSEGGKKDVNFQVKYDEGKYSIKYLGYDGNNTTWNMKNVEFDPCGRFVLGKSDKRFYIRLNIFVYNKPEHERNNRDYNNLIDDFEFVMTGDIYDIEVGSDNWLNKVSNDGIYRGYFGNNCPA